MAVAIVVGMVNREGVAFWETLKEVRSGSKWVRKAGNSLTET